ncbi:uncharacterized protein [Amphiura filiformis]|uniref:uncharacterized protein n=1 Tax=Amphiura filiformis TaxID=82378 RepID=UPI003B21D8C7
MADQEHFENFVKCVKALQTVCRESVLPCVEQTVRQWHWNAKNVKKLKPCGKSPMKCTYVKDSNKHRKTAKDCAWFPKSCANCITWGTEVECAYWPQWIISPINCRGPPIMWTNIKPCQLHEDPIEIAKCFAVRLYTETKINYTEFADFDAASLLKIMMHFGDCHKSNPRTYDAIKEVYDIRNRLSHMCVKDELQLTTIQRNVISDCLTDLVDCVEGLYGPFNAGVHGYLQDKIYQIMNSQVDEKGKDIIHQPLQADALEAMKEWLTKEGMETRDVVLSAAYELQDTIKSEALSTSSAVDSAANMMIHETKERITEEGMETRDVILSAAYEIQDTIKSEAQSTSGAFDSAANRVIHETKEWIIQEGMETRDVVHSSAYEIQDTIKSEAHSTSDVVDSAANRVIHEMQELLKPAEEQTTETNDDLQFTLDECRKELFDFYINTVGKVQLLPWDPLDVVEMEDIFVELDLIREESRSRSEGRGQFSMNNEIHFPIKSQSEHKSESVLKRNEDLVTLKTKQGQRVNRVLVRGIAGSGKSTLIANLAYKWATQDEVNPLSQFSLVFIVTMRDLQAGLSLVDIVFQQILPVDTKVSRADLEAIINNKPEYVLVLIDGLDEDTSAVLTRENEHIMQTLAGKRMRESCVIVTSRPYAIFKLGQHQKHFAQINLIGFSQANIEIYIRKYFSHDMKTADAMVDKIRSSHNIRNLCTIPVMLLMACQIWESQGDLPETETEIYQEAVLDLWNRYKLKYDMPDRNDSKLNRLSIILGKVAFENIMKPNEKLVFLESDFPPETFDFAFKVGLVTLERVTTNRKHRSMVTFVHKSFQEFFAAKYWVHVFETNQDEFRKEFETLSGNLIFSKHEVMAFTCGLNSQIATEFVLPLALKEAVNKASHGMYIGWLNSDDIFPLLCITCETQSKTLTVDHFPVLQRLFSYRKLFFNNINISSPRVFTTFHSFLKSLNRSKAKSLISIVEAELKIDRVGAFEVPLLIRVLRYLPKTQLLEIGFGQTAHSQLYKHRRNMIKTFSFLTNLKTLRLEGTDDKAIDLSCLLGDGIKIRKYIKHLEKIIIKNISCRGRNLANFIACQSSLKELQLMNSSSTPEDVKHVLLALESTSVKHLTLSHLHLSWACQYMSPVAFSMETIELNTVHLETKHLQELQVAMRGFRPLSKYYMSESYLRDLAKLSLGLEINMSHMTDDKLVALSNLFPFLPTLRILNFEVNSNIGPNGVVALAQNFKNVPSLKELLISNNENIGIAGLHAVFGNLHYVPKLDSLKIGYVIFNGDESCTDFVIECLNAISIDVEEVKKLPSKFELCIGENLFGEINEYQQDPGRHYGKTENDVERLREITLERLSDEDIRAWACIIPPVQRKLRFKGMDIFTFEAVLHGLRRTPHLCSLEIENIHFEPNHKFSMLQVEYLRLVGYENVPTNCSLYVNIKNRTKINQIRDFFKRFALSEAELIDWITKISEDEIHRLKRKEVILNGNPNITSLVLDAILHHLSHLPALNAISLGPVDIPSNEKCSDIVQACLHCLSIPIEEDVVINITGREQIADIRRAVSLYWSENSIIRWLNITPIDLKEVTLHKNPNVTLACLSKLFKNIIFVNNLYTEGLHIGPVKIDREPSDFMKQCLTLLSIDVDEITKSIDPRVSIVVSDRHTLKQLYRVACPNIMNPTNMNQYIKLVNTPVTLLGFPIDYAKNMQEMVLEHVDSLTVNAFLRNLHYFEYLETLEIRHVKNPQYLFLLNSHIAVLQEHGNNELDEDETCNYRNRPFEIVIEKNPLKISRLRKEVIKFLTEHEIIKWLSWNEVSLIRHEINITDNPNVTYKSLESLFHCLAYLPSLSVLKTDMYVSGQLDMMRNLSMILRGCFLALFGSRLTWLNPTEPKRMLIEVENDIKIVRRAASRHWAENGIF